MSVQYTVTIKCAIYYYYQVCNMLLLSSMQSGTIPGLMVAYGLSETDLQCEQSTLNESLMPNFRQAIYILYIIHIM